MSFLPRIFKYSFHIILNDLQRNKIVKYLLNMQMQKLHFIFISSCYKTSTLIYYVNKNWKFEVSNSSFAEVFCDKLTKENVFFLFRWMHNMTRLFVLKNLLYFVVTWSLTLFSSSYEMIDESKWKKNFFRRWINRVKEFIFLLHISIDI